MSSNSAKLRAHWKENEPEKYKAYLESQRENNKKRRDKKKQKLAEEVHTRAMKEKREKEKEMKRERGRRYREKKALESCGKSTNTDPGLSRKGKRRCGVSNSTKLRAHWKENEPEKFKAYLESQRLNSQRRRDEKKRKWAEEVHTRAMVEQQEKEKMLKRERNRRYREKKAAESGRKKGKRTKTGPKLPCNGKRRCDMTEEERRVYDNKVRNQYNHRMSYQRKAAYRKKNRDRMRAARQQKKEAEEIKSHEKSLVLGALNLVKSQPKTTLNVRSKVTTESVGIVAKDLPAKPDAQARMDILACLRVVWFDCFKDYKDC